MGTSTTNASIFTGGHGVLHRCRRRQRPQRELHWRRAAKLLHANHGSDQWPPSLPMPSVPTPLAWSGNCTFTTPATYSFVCQAHSNMTGTVQVVDPPPGNPPPPPPGGGGNPPPGGGGSGGGGGGSGGGGSGGGGSNDPGGSPTQPGSTSYKFTRKQTGTTLRGSVTAAAGSKIVVTALVSNRCCPPALRRRSRR